MAEFIDITGDHRIQTGIGKLFVETETEENIVLGQVLDSGVQLSMRYDRRVKDYVVMLTNLEIPFKERVVYCMHGPTVFDALCALTLWISVVNINNIIWSVHEF